MAYDNFLDQSSPNNSQSIQPKTQNKKDIDEQDLEQLYQSADCYYDEERYKEAFILYTKAAHQQHMMSQFHLGGLYFSGLGVEKNMHKAIEWYTRAACQNYNEAQYSLGYIYEYMKDHQESIRWYEIAAQNGHPEARCELKRKLR